MSNKLKAVVVVHVLVIITVFIAAITSIFALHWYQAILGIVTVLNLAYSQRCPLTDLENKLRVREGLPPIKGFIKHYFL